jgi:hypothetical protein
LRQRYKWSNAVVALVVVVVVYRTLSGKREKILDLVSLPRLPRPLSPDSRTPFSPRDMTPTPLPPVRVVASLAAEPGSPASLGRSLVVVKS